MYQRDSAETLVLLGHGLCLRWGSSGVHRTHLSRSSTCRSIAQWLNVFAESHVSMSTAIHDKMQHWFLSRQAIVCSAATEITPCCDCWYVYHNGCNRHARAFDSPPLIWTSRASWHRPQLVQHAPIKQSLTVPGCKKHDHISIFWQG